MDSVTTSLLLLSVFSIIMFGGLALYFVRSEASDLYKILASQNIHLVRRNKELETSLDGIKKMCKHQQEESEKVSALCKEIADRHKRIIERYKELAERLNLEDPGLPVQ